MKAPEFADICIFGGRGRRTGVYLVTVVGTNLVRKTVTVELTTGIARGEIGARGGGRGHVSSYAVVGEEGRQDPVNL